VVPIPQKCGKGVHKTGTQRNTAETETHTPRDTRQCTCTSVTSDSDLDAGSSRHEGEAEGMLICRNQNAGRGEQEANTDACTHRRGRVRHIDTVTEAFRRPRRVTGGVREQCGPRGDHQSEPGRVPRSSDVGATPDASDQQHTLCKQSRAQYLAANKGCTVLILWRSLTGHYTMRPHLTTVPLARSLSVSLSARHDARDGFRGWLFFCSYRVH
jgi:hypothetical protein